jgi:drug/metabolite transporter (DMT)-like permease
VLLMLGAVLQQIGITSTTVTNAGFLTALYVPLVPLLAWLILRTPPHWSVWPTSLGCLAGTWLLRRAGPRSGGRRPLGDCQQRLLGLARAFCRTRRRAHRGALSWSPAGSSWSAE